MTPKERMLAAFDGQPTDVVPIAPLYLGLYRAPYHRRWYREMLLERAASGAWGVTWDGYLELLVDLKSRLVAVFREEIDWQDIGLGPNRADIDGFLRVERDGDRVFWIGPDGARHEVTADPGESRDVWEAEHPPTTEAEVDALIPIGSAQQAIAAGHTEAARRIIARDAGRHLIAGATGTPFWGAYGVFGFSGMMETMHDRPELFKYVTERSLAQRVEGLGLWADAGVDCIFVEECLSSADLISPRQYVEFCLPTTRAMLQAIRDRGLRCVHYVCGDVYPRLDRIRELPFDAFGVEESKKGFTLDISEIRRRLGPDVTLLGNVDVRIVRDGSRHEIAAEARRQVDHAGRDGRFIMSLGSPLTLDTPPEKLDMLTEATRGMAVGS